MALAPRIKRGAEFVMAQPELKRPRQPMHCLCLNFSFMGLEQKKALFLIPAQEQHCMPALFTFRGTPGCSDWARFSNILLRAKLVPELHHFVYAYCKAVVCAKDHTVSAGALTALLNVIGVDFKVSDGTECQRLASSMIVVGIVQLGPG